MGDTSGDTKAVSSFNDPSLEWGDSAPETASPAAEPASSEPAADPPPEGATALPATDATNADAPSEPGPIPYSRHKEILEGERTKLAEQEAKWQRVAWADELATAGYTPEQIREAIGTQRALRENPVAALEELYGAIQNSPHYAEQARSFAGKLLGSKAQAEDAEPQPDLIGQDANGQFRVYSAEQLAKREAWLERRMVGQLEQRFQPLLQAHQQAQQREQQQARDVQEAGAAKAEFDAFKDRPHFAEHKADILAFMQAKQWQVPLSDAYNHILVTKVIPKLQETGKAQAMADFQKQAQASSAKPSSAAPVTPATPKSFFDKDLVW
jgi:hypothetical protein